MLIRKTLLIRERTETDEMGRPCAPLTRVAALAVLRNPFAGIDQDDLTELFCPPSAPMEQFGVIA